MNKGDLLLGLIIGAATGYVAGILTAPAKGSETMKELENFARVNLEKVSSIHESETAKKNVVDQKGS